MTTALFKPTGFLFITAMLAYCSKRAHNGSNDSSNEPKEEQGYVTGKKTDRKNKPIAEAKALLENAVHYASYVRGRTNEQETYEPTVDPESWKISASITKEYYGQTYHLSMHPDKANMITPEGTVRHFVWKPQGADPCNGLSHHGGLPKWGEAVGLNDDGGTIELRLTPKWPIIDGSQEKAIRLRRREGH